MKKKLIKVILSLTILIVVIIVWQTTKKSKYDLGPLAYSVIPDRFPINEARYTENDLKILITKAQNGDAKAQLNLGDYINSLSSKESKYLPANIGSEREWYLKSANQNNLIASWRYLKYEYSNGPEYIKWLKKIVSLNDIYALDDLFDVYYEGKKIEKNIYTAAMWARVAKWQVNQNYFWEYTKQNLGMFNSLNAVNSIDNSCSEIPFSDKYAKIYFNSSSKEDVTSFCNFYRTIKQSDVERFYKENIP